MSENPEEHQADQPVNGPDSDINREPSPAEADPTKIRIEKNPAELLSEVAGFFRNILSLRNDTYDVPGILTNVREGIVFSGYNVWILMFSIIIASVGLNVDSTAVIIGAMLISPLMGPIRGIGFGVGMNDFKLLLESLKNFGITVAISLTTSIIYFLVTPIDAITENIFSRTEPTFLDVVIAFFGGLAGVVALSQKKADTVIPGVAIATALMPPLCTAGYGIANGEWSYFLGASYLFLLNTLLIATSTYIFIRYLRFPKKEYLTPKIEKRVRMYTLIFIIVVVAPSIYLFYRMTKRSIFETNALNFVEEVIKNTDDNIAVEPTYVFDWKNSYIELDITNYYADTNVIQMWKRQMSVYDLENVDLHVKQGEDVHSTVAAMLEKYDGSQKGANTLAQLLSENQNILFQKEKELEYLKENPILKPDPLQLDHLLAGFKIDYPEYKAIYVNRSFGVNSKNQLDTTYTMTVEFKNNVEEESKKQLNSKISRRLKLELLQKANFKQDSVKVIEMPR